MIERVIIYHFYVNNFFGKGYLPCDAFYIDFLANLSRKDITQWKTTLKKTKTKEHYYLDKIIYLSNQSNLFIQYFYIDEQNPSHMQRIEELKQWIS